MAIMLQCNWCILCPASSRITFLLFIVSLFWLFLDRIRITQLAPYSAKKASVDFCVFLKAGEPERQEHKRAKYNASTTSFSLSKSSGLWFALSRFEEGATVSFLTTFQIAKWLATPFTQPKSKVFFSYLDGGRGQHTYIYINAPLLCKPPQ